MVSVNSPQRPLPAPDPLTRPFWEAAAAGELHIQRCAECGYYNHPPQPICDRCAGGALHFEPVSGRGSIYSFTINYQRNVAGFQDVVPYINLVVELEEQPRLLLVSDVLGPRPDWVAIGHPVRVAFEPLSNGMAPPQFVSAA